MCPLAVQLWHHTAGLHARTHPRTTCTHPRTTCTHPRTHNAPVRGSRPGVRSAGGGRGRGPGAPGTLCVLCNKNKINVASWKRCMNGENGFLVCDFDQISAQGIVLIFHELMVEVLMVRARGFLPHLALGQGSEWPTAEASRTKPVLGCVFV